MLTGNVTARRDIPGEPGQHMTLRQLGWRQLAEAEEARSAVALRSIRNMGGEVFSSIQNARRDDVDRQAAEQQQADPLAKYDQATVLYAGIVEWSYPERVSRENIDKLDPDTARWAATEIINLGKPPMEVEIEQRFFNSPASSTATTAMTGMATGLSSQNGSSL